jgi:hypothetical protein
MLDFLRPFLYVLAAPLRTQAQLEAEVTVLRHQLNVLRRQAPSKPRLTTCGCRKSYPYGQSLFSQVSF